MKPALLKYPQLKLLVHRDKMYVSPEISLIIVAVAMCSILVLFTVASMLIYRCCKDIEIQQIPATVYQVRASASRSHLIAQQLKNNPIPGVRSLCVVRFQ